MTEEKPNLDKQKADLESSVAMLNVALLVIGDVQITIKNNKNIIQCFHFLSSVKDNTEAELKRLDAQVKSK